MLLFFKITRLVSHFVLHYSIIPKISYKCRLSFMKDSQVLLSRHPNLGRVNRFKFIIFIIIRFTPDKGQPGNHSPNSILIRPSISRSTRCLMGLRVSERNKYSKNRVLRQYSLSQQPDILNRTLCNTICK